ncbi:MAG: DUF2779 domain-containing protein [Clostridiaceae bacterium]|nr:DUF2779 domain-containing protein [Clostridiaceae bacterium]
MIQYIIKEVENMFLTKSKFNIGLNCPRCFWNAMKETGIEESLSPQEELSKEDVEIRRLAKSLFDNTVDLSNKDFESDKATLEGLPLKTVIFGAGFKAFNLYARVDILVPSEDDGYDLIEVRSSTKVKDEFIYEVAFQKYVCEKAGLKIKECKVMHLYDSYIKKGETNLNELLVTINITEKVEGFYDEIPKILRRLHKISELAEAPVLSVNKYLLKEYPCEFNSECWSFLPKDNASELYRINKDKVVKLFMNNIFEIKKVPDAALNKNQLIQKKAIINNETYINKEEINKFIKQLQYPIYYFNIEAFNEAVPRFYGTKPYAQIPFQYSVFVQEEKGKLEHHEFLHRENTSPKKSILESILKVLGNKGSIVVFNAKFQKTRLKELASLYPEHNTAVEKILNRIVDLAGPFTGFHYYNPLQKGSCSIKNILTAVTGGSYEESVLDTSELYLKATLGEELSEEEKNKVFLTLLEECKQDIKAMVDIVSHMGTGLLTT